MRDILEEFAMIVNVVAARKNSICFDFRLNLSITSHRLAR